MEHELQRGVAHAVRLRADAPWATPVATVTTAGGRVLETPTATHDTTATTVASGAATIDRVPVASPTGIVAGRWYRFGGAGGPVAEVSAVEGSILRLVDPLPEVPAAGTAVASVEVTLTIGAVATAELGDNFLLELTDTDGRQVTRTFAVATYPFRGPAQPEHVRTLIARTWPSEAPRIADQRLHRRICDQVNSSLRARLASADRYLYRYWSPAVLEEPARIAVRLLLADEHGLSPRNRDVDEYVRGLRLELRDRMAALLQSNHAYDDNGDGVIDTDEAAGVWGARIGRGL